LANSCVKRIDGRTVNDFPIWERDGGRRWLYSTLELSAWMIGGPDEEAEHFKCDTGFVTSGDTHGGRMPDKMDLGWFTCNPNGDDWKADSDVKCTIHDSRIGHESPTNRGGVENSMEVSFSFVLENLSYDRLVANERVLAALRDVMKDVIVSEAGFTDAHVELEFSVGAMPDDDFTGSKPVDNSFGAIVITKADA